MLQEECKYLIPEESNCATTKNVKELRTLENNLRKVFENNKYEEIIVPMFEYMELYKNVYTNFDEEKAFKCIGKNGNVISLRWDFTIPIARHYVSENIENEARYSYFGNVYRKEKSYKGRKTENYQAGIELINVPGINGNIEVLNLLQSILKELNLSNLKVELGSAKLFNRICELTGNKQKIMEILNRKNISEIEKFISNNNQLSEELKILLLKLPRLFGNVDMLDNIISEVKDEVILKELKQLKSIYDKITYKENVVFDLSMCPAMEYYTCLMFKVYSPYSPEPIITGGRYDSLYKNFKKNVSAIGMGIYLNNILNAIEKEGKNNDKDSNN